MSIATQPIRAAQQLRHLCGVTDRIVVVDTETTGLRRGDRIVEVAAVTIDLASGRIGEWTTLVNPQRDVGPTWIHRVTPSMLVSAPTWRDIAGSFAQLLHGAVLCGHNLHYDLRMIGSEFDRLGHTIDLGIGIDTYPLTGRKLVDACQAEGVVLRDAHTALGDARATAELLSRVADRVRPGSVKPARAVSTGRAFPARALDRSAAGSGATPTPTTVTDARARLSRAAVVCFTGNAIDTAGHLIDRSVLRARAQAAGLRVTDWINPEVDVLIAADTASLSKKANQARSKGIPVIDAATFLAATHHLARLAPVAVTAPAAGRRAASSGAPRPARVAATAGVAGAAGAAGRDEVLTCRQCGGEFERQVTRGRKPVRCVPCREGAW